MTGEDIYVIAGDEANQVEAQSPTPRVSLALVRVNQVATVACGLVIALPATVTLLTQATVAGPADWGALAVAIAIAALALAGPLRARGAWLIAASGLVLLLAPMMPLNYQAAWLALPSVTIATCGVAALALPWRPAVVVIVVAAGLSWLDSGRLPVLQIPAGENPAFLPTLALLSALGLAVFFSQLRRTLKQVDDRSEELRRIIANQAEQLGILRSRMAIHRRIHETVLNTLTAISMGIERGQREQARMASRRDLQELQHPGLPSTMVSVQSIVAQSIERASVGEMRVDAQVMAPQPLSPTAAVAVRDALVESLRNVARHAQVGKVRLTARQHDGVTEIAVVDTGTGISPQALASFGRESGIVRGVEAVFGSYEISSTPGGGTSVRIRVPNADVESAPAAWALPTSSTAPISTLYVGLSTSARIGMLGNVACLALWLPWIGQRLPGPAWPLILMTAFVLLNAVLVIAWHSRWRTWVAAAVVVASVGGLLSLAPASSPCGDASVIPGVIATMGGGGLFLAVTALPRGWPRAATVVACGLSSVLLTVSLPPSCPLSLQTAIDVTVFLAAIAYALHSIDVAFARSQQRAQQAWQQVVQQRVQSRAKAARLQAWAEVDDDTRLLLAAVASGELDPTSPATRDRASRAAQRIRAQLRERPTIIGAPAYVQELASHVPRLPNPVVAGAIQREDPFPAEVISIVCAAVEASGPGPWTWHLFGSDASSPAVSREQHVLRGPAPGPTQANPSQRSAATRRPTDLGVHVDEAIEDCRVSLVVTQAEISILVTRPMQGS